MPIDQQELADAMGFRDMGEALHYLCGGERGEWSQEAVADMLGVAKRTVGLWMGQWGVPPRGRVSPGRKDKYKAHLKRLGHEYVAERTSSEIAGRVGCAKRTVNHYLRLWGWKPQRTQFILFLAE